jgi:hypothetical protein
MLHTLKHKTYQYNLYLTFVSSLKDKCFQKTSQFNFILPIVLSHSFNSTIYFLQYGFQT